VTQQIQQETTERKTIDALRNAERSKAMNELQEWKNSSDITRNKISEKGELRILASYDDKCIMTFKEGVDSHIPPSDPVRKHKKLF